MDLSYLLWLQGLRESLSGALDGFFLLVSQLGRAELPMAATLIVYWCFSRELGQRLLFTLNGSDLLNNVLKLSFCVYRPWVREPALHPVEKALSTATGYSFPSGHSSKAGAFFGSLGIAGKKRRWVPWACGAVILLVLISRNYLGVHTPQDVLAGAAVGLFCAFLLPCLLRRADEGHNRDLLIGGIGAALCGLFIWYVLAKSYPADRAADGSLLVDPVKMQKDFFLSAGAVLGMLAGWLLERRKVRFTTDCGWGVKLLRLLSGLLIGFVGFYTLLRHWLQSLMGTNWGAMLGVALAMFYLVGLHPMLFTWAEKKLRLGTAAEAKA